MDAYYSRAIEIVTTDRKASTSFIQRRLQIGYNTAASLMERMEAEGIVSPANNIGKRDVLKGPGFQPFDSGVQPVSQPDHIADTGNMVEPVEATSPEEPKDVKPEPEPELEPEAEYTDPVARFTCASCDITAAAQGRIKSYVQRFNNLLDDAASITADLKEVKDEAKGEGFDAKIIMRVVRESRKDKEKRYEEMELFDLYASAAGLDL